MSTENDTPKPAKASGEKAGANLAKAAAKTAEKQTAAKKKPRIWLVSGHSAYDPGATPAHGLDRGPGKPPMKSEADLAIEQRALITPLLKKHGFQVMRDADHMSLVQTIRYIENGLQPGDVVIDLHFNAATPAAHGTEVFFNRNASNETKKLARQLSANIAEVLVTVDRGAKNEQQSAHRHLGILHAKARGIKPQHSLLIETCFITNRANLNTYDSNREAVAETIADTLHTFFN